MFPANPRDAMVTVERCLKAILGWMWVIKSKLNPNKTEVLVVGRNSDLGMRISLILDVASTPPAPCKQICSFGVWLDPDLLLDKQVAIEAMSTFHQFQPFPSRKLLPLLYMLW